MATTPPTPTPWLDKDGELVPGIYPDVPFDTYATWPAANHSMLKHFGFTPAHAYYEWTHQQESTSFQALGHLVHQAVLEPALFASSGPVVAPRLDRRTTAGKAAWSEFLEQNKGRQVVSADDMDVLQGILASVANHAGAREALYGFGNNELSIVWEDQETGVLCKGRIDRLCEIGAGQPVILDVKTLSRPAATHRCQSAVMEYGYHQQAWLYLDGLATLAPPDVGVERAFVWLFCETEPPYCVRLFQAEEAALSIGCDEMRKYLRAYAECSASRKWPGWPEGMDLLGLPAWAYKRFDLE